MNIRNTKVATQLMLGFSILILFMAALGGTSLYIMGKINAQLVDVQGNWMPSVTTAQTMLAEMRAVNLAQYRALTADNAQRMQDARTRITAALGRYTKASEQYRHLISSPAEQSAYDELQALLARYIQIGDQLPQSVEQGKEEEAANTMKDTLYPVRTAMEAKIQQIIKINQEGAAQAVEHGQASYAQSHLTIIAFTLAAALAGLGIALLISRRLTRQLGGEPGEAMWLSGQIAAGNLAARLELKSNDNGSLMRSLMIMRDQLSGLVGQIQHASTSIHVAAQEIAQGNIGLSQRTEEQAASLEETASSMEELTSTVQQNAGNAKQASSMASAGAEVARRGEAEIADVVATMREMSVSSHQMSDIISVIEGISFQTNILALNAAVEAARAGENGRGFAVVASEVRALAQRSSAAAKEIKDLIEDSVGRIRNGSQLVEAAGATIAEIMQSSVRTTDLMKEIAAASEEQSAGIGQVNTAIVQMDQVTQQNAALVEEAAAAAQSMMQQAQALTAAVSVFKLDDQALRTLPGMPAAPQLGRSLATPALS
ncbi:chemotaxis protein [Herbaspirillum seropedicae]|uniref:methyl-accepting chemotaxis protein n=1 Tax=Herbaspirillum seropedicae TaxID=964 RepID=UPI00065271C5|nr:methyl-accepting chemotaxis protein [Herbaspirillum seropedicae]AKN68282.1 chemotaxis protein [Herbaspirillum seropedicae]UMU22522.1 chemotaxis protein [Herbaspirillum seropedicae]